MKKTINAQIVADSINQMGDRITTYLLTYPRFIHAELMTHRVFSRNSASSRAIPFEKMVKMVEEDPFIPIAWQKNHKGMQGTEYIINQESVNAKYMWLYGRNDAIECAKALANNDVTKQLCNRLLEPFMWHTILVTATEYDNFFELRCPKYKDSLNEIYKSKKDYLEKTLEEDQYKPNIDLDWYLINESQAEIHIQALAEAMWDARNESTPNQLEEGEWHMPFMGEFNSEKLLEISGIEPEDFELVCRKVATARCARLSYMTFDNEIDYEKDIKLHDSLLKSHHMSPFEHCARTMSEEEYQSFYKGKGANEGHIGRNENLGWCNNFKGFIQYRYLIENGLSI